MVQAGMCYFFYGTLLDPDVRRVVLGPLADGLVPETAWLRGWCRVRLTGRPYPVIVPRAGMTVEGCVVRGLPASAAAKLDRFEGPEYRCSRLEVTTASGESLWARAYVSNGRVAPTPVAWSLEHWKRRYKVPFLRRLHRR